MRIITALQDLRWHGEVIAPSGTRVVLDDWGAFQVGKVCARDGVGCRDSGMGHYTRHYCGQDLAGKRLLAWRGHGLGDQIIWAGVLREIRRRYPTARIDLFCAPPSWEIWRDMPTGWTPDVGADAEFAALLPFRPVPMPLPFDRWREYDYHLLGEDLCESDLEPDQPCTWDAQLDVAGIDPESVPAARKRGIVPVSNENLATAARWLDEHGLDGHDYIIYQPHASTPIRSLEPSTSRRVLAALCAEFADYAVIAMGGQPDLDHYARPAPAPSNLIECFDAEIGVAMGIGYWASCVVCPDSMWTHAAAAVRRGGVPCVSMWCSFRASERIKYYPRQRAVTVELECAPCRRHEKNARAEGCPLAQHGESRYCRGLAAIDPEDVIEAVNEVMDREEKTQ